MPDLTKDVGDEDVQWFVALIHQEKDDQKVRDLEKELLEETGPTPDHHVKDKS